MVQPGFESSPNNRSEFHPAQHCVHTKYQAENSLEFVLEIFFADISVPSKQNVL